MRYLNLNVSDRRRNDIRPPSPPYVDCLVSIFFIYKVWTAKRNTTSLYL